MEKRNKREKMHLINLIGKRSNNTPNFALLIGAGASVSSGVKLASQMTAEWQRQLYSQAKTSESFDDWLKEQDWYGDEEEYSILFEKVYDQRSQRRIYIEECVKDAKPSWGYIYLANIIAHIYFNAVFTPNFDDLLNEACFLYADCRPLVCAHDSAVVDIRVTSARPKIIKLHGDFLYDSIKNTVRETETLENNMRDKFMQFAREYGLVVIGYGGNDRSIMDILDRLLMSQGYFPNGLYWCVRRGDTVSKKVERLLRRERTYWIEIEGFDEFMSELHNGLVLTLPDAVRDPYKATTEKLNRFIEKRKEIRHKIIENDCMELERQVKKFEQVISGKLDRLVPYLFLGDTEYEHGDYEKALNYYERAHIEEPDNLDLMMKMIESFNSTERFKEAVAMSDKLISRDPTLSVGYILKGVTYGYMNRLKDSIRSFDEALKRSTIPSGPDKANALINRSNTYLKAGKWKEALSDAEEALEMRYSDVAMINKCIAFKQLNKEKESKEILQNILPKILAPYLRACVFAVLDDKRNMLKELEVAIKEDGKHIVTARSDPDFADYREDVDFRKLLNRRKLRKKRR